MSGFVFLIFLVTLLLGFIKKKKKLKLASLFIFLTFIACATWTGYQIISTAFDAAKHFSDKAVTLIDNIDFPKAFEPRTGDEIYDALFDKRKTDCIEVLNYQDQVVPKIDYAIWLHFKTCPEELKRILTKHDFSVEKLTAENRSEKIPVEEWLEWFAPITLGDTIIVYEYSSQDYRNIQTIWSKNDSTEVFVRDIFD